MTLTVNTVRHFRPREMAGDGVRMADLEDGELESDYESDMRDAAEERVQVKTIQSVQHALAVFISAD